jgi:hypothetical protein
MLPAPPSLERDHSASSAQRSVLRSSAANVLASHLFWGALSIVLMIAAVATITLTDSGVSWWLFCFLLAASWVASLVERMLDPDPRDRSDGGGWWDSGGGGE